MSRAESTRQPKRQRPAECPSPFQQQEEEEGAQHGAATAIDWLTLLSQELLICVLKCLEDYSDCARFSLASPRLGLTALQNGLQLPRFQHPLFAVAMRLTTMETDGITMETDAHSRFAEAWLRKYVAGCAAASPDDFEWIKASSPELHIAQITLLPFQRWHLVRGGVPDAKVRMKFTNGTVGYYEGEKGAERRVRVEFTNGSVHYFEGEEGAERLVRAEFANSNVMLYYEGEQGAERVVRAVRAKGTVILYLEGEQGAERRVRAEFADGTVEYCEA
eukprot:COSAG01_NODE_9220_length_2514_cov_2.614493_1_plen_275_part_10